LLLSSLYLQNVLSRGPLAPGLSFVPLAVQPSGDADGGIGPVEILLPYDDGVQNAGDMGGLTVTG